MEYKLHDKYILINRLHRDKVSEFLKKYDLYLGQPRLLFIINDTPGISQIELAQQLKISKESLSVSLNRLEHNGLIKREVNPLDKRSKKIFLTDSGIEIVSKCKDGFTDLNQSLFNCLDEEEKKVLDIIFNKILQNMEER